MPVGCFGCFGTGSTKKEWDDGPDIQDIPFIEVQAPSIRPVDNFNPQQDCESLRTAMRGVGTDEAALVNILCRRTYQQRAEIEKTYREVFGKELERKIDDETSGNFFKVLIRLLKEPVEFAAFELNDAVKGAGTDEEGLIEILCTPKTNSDISAIKQKYQEMYNVTLEADVIDDTSKGFQTLLVKLIAAGRNETNRVVKSEVKADARTLYEAGELHLRKTAGSLVDIIGTRSIPQLGAVMNIYKENSGKDLTTVIQSQFKGVLMDTLVGMALGKPMDKALIGAAATGPLKDLVIGMTSTKRSDSPAVDLTAAADDAKKLLNIGQKKPDYGAFIEIFCTRSYSHLRRVLEAYKFNYKTDLVEVVKSEFKGDIVDGLTGLISAVANTQTYFAERLRHALSGITTHSILIRVITWRCDIDLDAIKAEYQRLYNRSLKEDVADKTGIDPDYKGALMALLGD